jgi:hypothetical protein
LVVAKVMKRLAVSEQAAENFDVERYHLGKLGEMDIMKQYQIPILENLNYSEDINRAWENIQENIKFSAKNLRLYELEKHKPWFDEEYYNFWIKGSRLKCSGYRIQSKQCKM